MNFFDTPLRRRILFGCLYLSEGAPIGFIWLALPTRLRASGVPVERITWLAAILVLPWTMKFAWAPVIDLLRTRWWTLRHWIVAAQIGMGSTLTPLIWLEPERHFSMLAWLLLAHAVCAATQDVAIDALCISATPPDERGQYNGWMQAGMLLGRATMGGGALVMAAHVGDTTVVIMLIVITTFSMALVILSRPPDQHVSENGAAGASRRFRSTLRAAILDRNTWVGLGFAAVGGAAFKSLEVIYGPYLVDRGFQKETIGWFSVGPMIGAMIVGSVIGGWLTDRVGRRRCVAGSLAMIVFAVVSLAISDQVTEGPARTVLLYWLAATAFGIGTFTASSYALFMNISRPAIAATQFSAFMGATNGCESWSSFAAGRIISAFGYPAAMLAMSAVSLVSLPLLVLLNAPSDAEPDDRSIE